MGSVVIITYLLHYFGVCFFMGPQLRAHDLTCLLTTVIAVAALIVGYWYFAAYYRVSARELKRLGMSVGVTELPEP